MDKMCNEMMDGIAEHLSIRDVDAAVKAGSCSQETAKNRKNPIRHLGKSFAYPHLLLAAMADTGCVISGSSALEYFVPGSTGKDSDWDFYVPDDMDCLRTMLGTLATCGVLWDELHSPMEDLVNGPEGTVVMMTPLEVDRIHGWSFTSMPTFAHTAMMSAAGCIMYVMNEYIGTARMYSSSMLHMYKIRKMTNSTSRFVGSSFNIELMEGGFDHGEYGSVRSAGNHIAIVGGEIHKKEDGKQKVQLMICPINKRNSSVLSYITAFWASHVQCFIAGMYAGHIYHDLAADKKAMLWEASDTTDHTDCMHKYVDRGYSFHKGNPGRSMRRVTALDENIRVVRFYDLYKNIPNLLPDGKHTINLRAQIAEDDIRSWQWYITSSRPTMRPEVDINRLLSELTGVDNTSHNRLMTKVVIAAMYENDSRVEAVHWHGERSLWNIMYAAKVCPHTSQPTRHEIIR